MLMASGFHACPARLGQADLVADLLIALISEGACGEARDVVAVLLAEKCVPPRPVILLHS